MALGEMFNDDWMRREGPPLRRSFMQHRGEEGTMGGESVGPSEAITPRVLNRFKKTLTRDRVVPIIEARVSWEIVTTTGPAG